MTSSLRYVLTRSDFDAFVDHEIPVTIHYIAHKACPGSREGGRGLPLEPDEPAHIEISSVLRDDSTGEAINITPRERELIEKEIGEHEYEKSLPPED